MGPRVAQDGPRVRDIGCVKCSGSSGPGESEEHEECTREPDHVVVAQLAKVFAQLRAGGGGDIVDHQPTRLSEVRHIVDLDEQSDPWCISRVGCERQDDQRCGGVEAVVFDKVARWARFLRDFAARRRASRGAARVIRAASAGRGCRADSDPAGRIDLQPEGVQQVV